MDAKYDGMAGQLQLLDDAFASIDQTAKLKADKDNLESEGKKLAKELASGQKKMNSDIESTLKKKRNEVASEYDKQIDDVTGKMKKVKNERDKARTSGMKERTKNETSGIADENKDLKYSYKDLIKTSNIPAFCGSKLFNILYSPATADEYLTLFLIAIALLFGVPTLVLYLTKNLGNNVMTIIMFAVFIVLFVALYIVGWALLKKPYAPVIRDGRSLRKRIQHNKKAIKKISSDIKKDNNDEQYGLGDFDYEIAKYEGQIEEINGKKKEALDTFDNATSKVITDEITNAQQPGIDATQKQVDANAEQLKAATEAYNALNQNVSENFSSVLGKDFFTKERIMVLKTIINEGNATTVQGAIDFFKNSNMG